jgi:hypothetical protein
MDKESNLRNIEIRCLGEGETRSASGKTGDLGEFLLIRSGINYIIKIE